MQKKNKRKLSLKKSDKKFIRNLLKGKTVALRILKRALILKSLSQSQKRISIAKLLDVSLKTVTNIQNKYLLKGLMFALHEMPRSGKKRVITDRKIQKIAAIACTKPPDGFSRWSLALLAETIVKKTLLIKSAKRQCGLFSSSIN